jgi:hypothetical protein
MDTSASRSGKGLHRYRNRRRNCWSWLLWQAALWRPPGAPLGVTAKESNDNLMFTKPERSKHSSPIDGIAVTMNALARAICGEEQGITYMGGFAS